MTKNNSVSDTASSALLELDPSQLEQVQGGNGTILVPTEECPTCASGADPTVLDARFQNLLAGDQ